MSIRHVQIALIAYHLLTLFINLLSESAKYTKSVQEFRSKLLRGFFAYIVTCVTVIIGVTVVIFAHNTISERRRKRSMSVMPTMISYYNRIDCPNDKEEREENEVCCICLDNACNTLFHPCKHKRVCIECAGRMPGHTCPLCRSKIETILFWHTLLDEHH